MVSIRKSFGQVAAKSPEITGNRRLAEDLIDRGVAAERRGDTEQALESYRRAVEADPGYSPAHANLAIALHAKGELAAAIAAHQRSIDLDPLSPAGYYNLAWVHLDTGEALLAESGFRKALELRDQFPEAYVGLASALEVSGRNDEALDALNTAIALRGDFPGARLNLSILLLKLGQRQSAEAGLNMIDLDGLLLLPERYAELESIARRLTHVWPDFAPSWKALGTVLALQQRFEEAVPALERSLAWLEREPEIHNNLGAALHALGRLGEAHASYNRALQLNPDYHEARINLGKIRVALNRPAEAEADFRCALRLKPDGKAHSHLADVLQSLGRSPEAVHSYVEALRLEPDSHVVHNNFAVALLTLGRLSESEAHFRRALEIEPSYFEAHNNLGNTLQALRRLSEAEASYRLALDLMPESPPTHSNLGSVLRELGRVPEAEASFRRAIELDPGYSQAHSNLLFVLNCTARLSREDLFAEHLAWARQHETPFVARRQPHQNSRDPHRRLRIGYVSPDFRRHSVAYFIEPVLACHNRATFEVYCYSNVSNPDDMTARLLGLADRARTIAGLSDAQVAEIVREDGIDILIDLAGHTARGRLGVFAIRPAPVQVSYLGYPNTTGMEAIDWRITDVHADPGSTDTFYSERLTRLPKTFLCFRPPDDAPETQPAPHVRNGCITFGSFNVLSKITPEVMDTWSRLVERVAGSRLVIKALGLSDFSARARLALEFNRRGIPENRLTLLPPDNAFKAHLAQYNEIDIGLDPFPYNGTTTTFEALWMGVPVVSLKGERHATRVGGAILANLGLGELIAESVEDYLNRAADLAGDGIRLRALRETMRQRISASPIRDEAGFAQELEIKYREMWLAWCES